LAGVDQLECLTERVLPCAASAGEERVQRRLLEVGSEACRREVDDLVAGKKPDPRRLVRGREDAEPGDGAQGSIPSARSSPTGSKKEQLPIEWRSRRRASASG